MSERTYIIRKNNRGYVIDGPALTKGPAHFESEQKAISLARALIGGKSGGGYIIRANGVRDFYQGSRHLSQDGLSQRQR